MAVEGIFHRWPAELNWSAETSTCPPHLSRQVHRRDAASRDADEWRSRPHVALLLSGALATFRGRTATTPRVGERVYQLHERVHNSTAVHVIGALERDRGATVTTFLCIGSDDVVAADPAAEPPILERLRVVEVRRSNRFGDNTTWGARRDELSWARLRDCFERALDFESRAPGASRVVSGSEEAVAKHEASSSLNTRLVMRRSSSARAFTHFIRARPDMVWCVHRRATS